MRLERISNALYKTPLAITPAGFETLDAIVRPLLVKGERPTKDFFGEPMDIKMEVENGTAVIPVYGPLINHASLMEKQCGATSYDDLKEDLQTAGNMHVKQCVFNFDSPGGQMAGCQEFADYIAQFQEDTGIPCYGFTDSQCCSAAYMLASACEAIYASRTSMVGSIGCIIGFLDVSKAYEMEGLKPVIFASGKYKSTGTPGTTLTGEQTEYLQGLVDQAFEQFEGHLASRRPQIDTDQMEGQVFFGADALKFNLVDEICDSLDDMLNEFDPQSP